MPESTLVANDVLHYGHARGELLTLTQPLSFWGGFDPASGVILDRSHPQCGLSISGKILVMPGSKGSAGTPGGVAEALRCKVGPSAFVLLTCDVNITMGVKVADFLYSTSTPVITITHQQLPLLTTGMVTEINGSQIALC